MQFHILMTFWKIIWVTYTGLVLNFLHQHLWILCPVSERQLNVLICLTCAIKDWASQVALVVKNLPAKARDIRDPSSLSGSGRCPGGGHSNPLHHSCLENPVDRGAWRATVRRVAKSQTRLSNLAHMNDVLRRKEGRQIRLHLNMTVFLIIS